MATASHSLLQSVEQFYQIIETYVSSHPEIAALVWGSVKLAFMALGNFTSYFQKFSELLRGFDQLVPRFAEYQRLFPGSNRLRCATYEFQTAIISCCSQMILVTRRPWKKQLLVALSQSFQTELRPFVDDIRSKAKEVKQEVGLLRPNHTIKSKCYRHKNDAKQVNVDKTSLDENKWNALLERLSHYDYAAAFKSARGKRHNGTAEWIFQTSEFESWYGNDASVILHVVGKIGSGKTVLTASIVDRLIRLRQQSLQAIAFFFVRFDDPPSQQSECITRSIVRQLFNHGSSDRGILRFLESSSDQFFDNDSLLALWSERIRSFKDFFLVLDGFDECALADRKAILSSISILSKACQKTTRVKVLVSSRISVKEEIDQANLTVIRMAIDVQNISEDLTKYAEEILKDRISTREMVLGDGNLYSDILQAVGVGGEGMFLWVFLTLEDICFQTSDLEIRESLESIPRNLPETFDRALQRIENNGKTNIVQTIFNWIAAVRLPLTLDQLKESLAVKIGQRHSEPERYINNIARLTAWCENLVQVEETDETVRFGHHSIREYLLRNSTTFRPW
ncbi:Vegetative incompatibility protein HET-E-1 [Colletotrichum viniferum]|nr:Vegetative incompatibility protein HET-E-1 [Colletotrichum viniferum]